MTNRIHRQPIRKRQDNHRRRPTKETKVRLHRPAKVRIRALHRRRALRLRKKPAGEVRGAGEEKPEQDAQSAQAAAAEPEKDGQMSEKQAELLLRSMKDEERRVQLDERKVARPVYNDW